MAFHAEDHHGGNMAVRPSWRCCDLPQTGSAQPLGADFICAVCALCFAPSRAIGNRELPSQSAGWQHRRAHHSGRRASVYGCNDGKLHTSSKNGDACRGSNRSHYASHRRLCVLPAQTLGGTRNSCLPEAIHACALGMEVEGFSCLTDWAAGLSPATLSHDDLSVVGNETAEKLVELLLRAFPQI